MTSMPALSPAFNDFLFATVCEERNEMPLSVISALARLDLDPWTEAADLAGMPVDGAASRLSSLLAGYIDDQPAQPDRATIAARLVTLLPQAAKAGVSGSASDGRKGQRFSMIAMLCAGLLASMATSFLMANLESGRGAVGAGSAPILSASRTIASTSPAPPSPR
jgi:hypothetical protein